LDLRERTSSAAIIQDKHCAFAILLQFREHRCKRLILKWWPETPLKSRLNGQKTAQNARLQPKVAPRVAPRSVGIAADAFRVPLAEYSPDQR
jgi:hypothetical protein